MPRITSDWELSVLCRQIEELLSMVSVSPTAAPGEWIPLFDVVEVSDSYLIRVDLPGIAAADLTVIARENSLRVSGRKRSRPEIDPACRCRRAERTFGSFDIEVPLPGPVDPERTTSRLAGGVLQVDLPKSSRVGESTIVTLEEEP